MNLIKVAVAALIGLFILTVSWMALYGPFMMVVDAVQTPLSAATTGQAKDAIDNYETYWRLGMGGFFMFTALGILAWWLMKAQQREYVTEAYQ